MQIYKLQGWNYKKNSIFVNVIDAVSFPLIKANDKLKVWNKEKSTHNRKLIKFCILRENMIFYQDIF